MCNCQEFPIKCPVCKCSKHSLFNCFETLADARENDKYKTIFICQCYQCENHLTINPEIEFFSCPAGGDFCIVCGKMSSFDHEFSSLFTLLGPMV